VHLDERTASAYASKPLERRICVGLRRSIYIEREIFGADYLLAEMCEGVEQWSTGNLDQSPVGIPGRVG